MVDENDWRLHSPGDNLEGLAVRRKRYSRWSASWDHDHCFFCWAKFMTLEDSPDDPETLHDGYAVAAHVDDGNAFPDDYFWICSQCFDDFRERFRWVVLEDEA